MGNIFATGSMQMASAYYDRNRLAIAQIDEYKDELGKLYDTETGMMRRVGPGGDARKTPEFQKALDEFVEATGITRDHAQQYLDYMQTEHNVDKATQAMQAQADKISAMTEMKIQAISFGGNPSDVLGLNGIEAQQSASSSSSSETPRYTTDEHGTYDEVNERYIDGQNKGSSRAETEAFWDKVKSDGGMI